MLEMNTVKIDKNNLEFHLTLFVCYLSPCSIPIISITKIVICLRKLNLRLSISSVPTASVSITNTCILLEKINWHLFVSSITIASILTIFLIYLAFCLYICLLL